jgi:hypothetical protein
VADLAVGGEEVKTAHLACLVQHGGL